MRQAFWVLVLACVFVTVELQRPQQLKDYWMDLGQRKLRERLNTKPNTNVAKNVIIFIGDGLGVSTVTAARIHKGQLAGKTGEEGSLFFENFPYVGLSKTYNTDRMVSDSAGTATAILCGVKTKFGLIGVDDRTSFGNCTSEEGASVDSILKWANAEGKSTGIITTTRITHATPASGFAHSASRYWEADADLPADARGMCTDIAKQMIEGDGSFIKVILGGGRGQFYHRNESDPEYPSVKGKRTDKNLINQWLQAKADMNMRAQYVWNSTGFNSVEPADVDFLIGLFEPSHMQYEGERNHDMEPSLAEMTEKAIKILKKNAKGFVLLVEGGRIDHGHHSSLARHAVTDTIAMDAAVEKAAELTSANDTLTVVTADHSHVFNIGGYAGRGIPILGVNDAENDTNGVPYTVLSYGNGPGYTAPREDPTTVNTSSWNYVYQSAVLTDSETHGGEEVPVYAQGPMSHLFDFVYEQSYIAHVMAYAACVGPNKDHCKMAPPTPTTSGGTSLEFSVTKALVVKKMVVAVTVAVILQWIHL